MVVEEAKDQRPAGESSNDPESYPMEPLDGAYHDVIDTGVDNAQRGSQDSIDALERGDIERAEEESEESLLPGHQSSSFPRKRSDRLSKSSGNGNSFLGRICRFIQGPDPPYQYSIKPIFPKIQKWPIDLLDRYAPRRGIRVLLLLALYGVWFLLFAAILRASIGGDVIPGHEAPVRLSCTARLWSNSTNCGLNGDDCQPFDTGSLAFRCPASCMDTKVLEPYGVGAQDVNYQPLVIGGPTGDQGPETSVYRGDSFICASAMHAGIIDNDHGGCGVLLRTGEKSRYPSVKANGISSIAFDSNFPLSFTFDPSVAAQCGDLRWTLLSLTAFFTAVLSLFTTSPAVFYWSVFTLVFFQIAVASDPPLFADVSEVVSIAVGRFLPAAFVGAVVYRTCVRRTLQGLTAQGEKTILWLGACWVGALDNYTFDRLPISRLTPHDLQQQPGAITVLLVLVGLIVTITLSQAWAFRNEGRLPRYLLIYGIMGAGLLVLAAIPHMNLRIHHYILGLVFLPGTALQTRPSLLYQGLLVGLFLNGIARWDFDSLLQTPAQLLDGARMGSLLPELSISPVVDLVGGAAGKDRITFSFKDALGGFDGISMLVNDVERFRTGVDGGAGENETAFEWARRHAGEKEYFRFGYFKRGQFGRGWYGDFTEAGVWLEDGTWVDIPESTSQ